MVSLDSLATYITSSKAVSQIIFGGNQLTACCARDAQLARFHDDASEEVFYLLLKTGTVMRVSLCVTLRLLCTFICMGYLE